MPDEDRPKGAAACAAGSGNAGGSRPVGGHRSAPVLSRPPAGRLPSRSGTAGGGAGIQDHRSRGGDDGADPGGGVDDPPAERFSGAGRQRQPFLCRGGGGDPLQKRVIPLWHSLPGGYRLPPGPAGGLGGGAGGVPDGLRIGGLSRRQWGFCLLYRGVFQYPHASAGDHRGAQRLHYPSGDRFATLFQVLVRAHVVRS